MILELNSVPLSYKFDLFGAICLGIIIVATLIIKCTKRKVDAYNVGEVLSDYLNSSVKYPINVIILPKITRTGVVKLYTNQPGVFVGRNGEYLNNIKKELVEKANARDVKLFEVKYIISNCEVY